MINTRSCRDSFLSGDVTRRVGVSNYEVARDLTLIDEDFEMFEGIGVEEKMLGRLECHNFIFSKRK